MTLSVPLSAELSVDSFGMMRWIFWQPLKMIFIAFWSPHMLLDIRRKGWAHVRDDIAAIWKNID